MDMAEGEYDSTLEVEDELTFQEIENFRDIGGYRTVNNEMVKRGLIYRSATPSDATKEDIQRLLRVYQINTWIDLRDKKEAKLMHENKDFGPLVSYFLHRYIDTNGKIILQEGSGDDRQSFTRVRYRVFLHLRSAIWMYTWDKSPSSTRLNYPILINCTMGKDRTGTVVAMILSALGVPLEGVKEDYVKSQQMSKEKRQQAFTKTSNTIIITAFTEAPPEAMDHLFEYIQRKYGSVEGYLDDIGFTFQWRDQLQNCLLCRSQ